MITLRLSRWGDVLFVEALAIGDPLLQLGVFVKLI